MAFLAVSVDGLLFGGYRPLSVRSLSGGAWTRVTDVEANSPACLDGSTLIWQQDAYKNEGRGAFLLTSTGQRFDRKAAPLAAGGGRWVAQYEQIAPGQSARVTVLHDGLDRVIYGAVRPGDSSGFWGAGQHSVGFDGTLVYTDRFQEGRGVVVESVDRAIVTVNPEIPVSATSCVDRRAVVVWSASESSHVWAWDGATWRRHRLAWPCFQGAAFRRGDAIYVVYSPNNRPVVVHRVDDASRGWLFGSPNKGFNALGWTDPAGRTSIVWSENAGATLASIKTAPLAGDPQPFAAAPDAPAPAPPAAAARPKFARPMFFAPYYAYSARYGVTSQPVGNAAILVESDDAELVDRTNSLPLILSRDVLERLQDTSSGSRFAGILNRTLYYYVHAGGGGFELGRDDYAWLDALPGEKPIVFYFDALEPEKWPSTLPAWMNRDRTFLAMPWYVRPGQSVDDFRASATALTARVAGYGLPIVGTPCFYNRNGALELGEILAALPVYPELVDRFEVIGLMPFADMRTGQGMQAFPVLYDAARRLFDAIPARPNRFQYWTPSDPDTRRRALLDLVSYSLAGFSPRQRDELHRLIREHY